MASAVSKRIEELGISQSELARRSGVSDTTLRRLLKDHAPITRRDKRAQLSLGLGWTTDSIDRLLKGQAPAVLAAEPPTELDELLEGLVRRIGALEAQVEALLDERGGNP